MRAADVRCRAGTVADVDDLLELVTEHASFERADLDESADAARSRRMNLCAALAGTAPRLHAVLAITEGRAVGYATASVEYSTWQAREYLHLDCLYVREGRRGSRIGARLLAEVVRVARELDIEELQWQTPAWNENACRFYRRAGATGMPKVRFTLALEGGVSSRGVVPPLGS